MAYIGICLPCFPRGYCKLISNCYIIFKIIGYWGLLAVESIWYLNKIIEYKINNYLVKGLMAVTHYMLPCIHHFLMIYSIVKEITCA